MGILVRTQNIFIAISLVKLNHSHRKYSRKKFYRKTFLKCYMVCIEEATCYTSGKPFLAVVHAKLGCCWEINRGNIVSDSLSGILLQTQQPVHMNCSTKQLSARILAIIQEVLGINVLHTVMGKGDSPRGSKTLGIGWWGTPQGLLKNSDLYFLFQLSGYILLFQSLFSPKVQICLK